MNKSASNGMLAKLVENWLDSIGERGYQPAYCTLLAIEGHTILHNTRHSPIENGKDIITLAPDGKRHLIQLKGNPGSRFKQSDFASHADQLSTLCNTRWGPATDGILEAPYFVTNGEIEEEARVAFDQFNNNLISRGLQPLTIVGRGELLSRFLTAVEAIAPSDPVKFSKFALLLVRPVTEDVSFQEFVDFFLDVLEIDLSTNVSKITRNSTACLVLAELLCSKHHDSRHAFETISIRLAALCAIFSYHHKNAAMLSNRVQGLIVTFKQEIFNSIVEIIRTMSGRERHYLQGSYIHDAIQIGYRREVVSSLVAAALIDRNFPQTVIDYSDLSEEDESSAVKLLRYAVADMKFWGERSIVRYLLVYFCLSNRSGGGDADLILRRAAYLLRHLLLTKSGSHFPSIYYEFDEFARNFLIPEMAKVSDLISREDFLGYSYLFRAIFLLLARKNWKVTCKKVWPEFTRYIHTNTRHANVWEYCYRPDKNSQTNDKVYEDMKLWPEILGEAEEHKAGEGFEFFRGDLFLLMVYLTICPDRANTETLLTLDRVLGDSINLENRTLFRDQRR